MLASIRKTIIFLWISHGKSNLLVGSSGTYEAQKLLEKLVSLLKTGGSVAAHHGYDTTQKKAGKEQGKFIGTR